MIRIATSLLAANFKELDKEVTRCIKAKADWLHLDIMDGTFVPNISYGFPIMEAITDYPIFKDVHLMIANPRQYALAFIDAGADLITFHLEAIRYKKDIKDFIKYVHEYERAVGISIKPHTPIEMILPYLKDIDVVLVMSVEPGFGGQKFMEEACDRIQQLRTYIDEHHLDCFIEVDGGINEVTAKKVLQAGADILVAGSYLFNGDMKEKIKSLKKVTDME